MDAKPQVLNSAIVSTILCRLDSSLHLACISSAFLSRLASIRGGHEGGLHRCGERLPLCWPPSLRVLTIFTTISFTPFWTASISAHPSLLTTNFATILVMGDIGLRIEMHRVFDGILLIRAMNSHGLDRTQPALGYRIGGILLLVAFAGITRVTSISFDFVA